MPLNFSTHTLSNGLRIIHVASKSKVAYCGLAINAGSRDEEPGRFGIAHFVEHTVFKGTTHRRAWHILNRMERVGGELNAYTTKEGTMLYSIFPRQHLERATELIADLVANSQFPDAELAREREVVMDEVDSYRDTPSEAVYDDFEDLLFRGSLLGHNILGSDADLRNITASDCRAYLDNLYVPSNMVFFVLGDFQPDKAFRIAEKHFGKLSHQLSRVPRIAPAVLEPFHEVTTIDAHQSHTVVGAQLFSMFDERRYAMSLLSNIIGGPGMNSMLNVAIRERRGLVYTVESSLSLLSDCGMIEIYFGCDDNHVSASQRIIGNIFDTLATKPLTDKALDAAKRQYVGQLLVSSDNQEAMAMAIGKNFLYFNSIQSDEETAERINAVTARDIMDCASLITLPRCSVLTMQ